MAGRASWPGQDTALMPFAKASQPGGLFTPARNALHEVGPSGGHRASGWQATSGGAGVSAVQFANQRDRDALSAVRRFDLAWHGRVPIHGDVST